MPAVPSFKQVVSLLRRNTHFIHPVLFALFPLFSFYGANVKELATEQFSLSGFVIFNLTIGALGWLGAWVVARDKYKAGVLTAVFLAIFFTFGRAHKLIAHVVIDTPFGLIGPAKLLAAISALILIGAWFLLRKTKPDRLQKLNYWLAVTGAALVVSALAQIIPAQLSSSGTAPQTGEPIAAGKTSGNKSNQPDVYYILLDGYARSDTLKERFGYDNSEFVDFLRKEKFYVAEKSTSNYAHTHFSIPSTLNMKYLNYLTDEVGEDSEDRTPLRELFTNNETIRQFKSRGYKYLTIGSTWSWPQSNPNADIQVESNTRVDFKVAEVELDEFALVYLQTTALKPLIIPSIKDNFATRILNAFSNTEKVTDIDGPTYSFTHINAPHPPYIFDRNGPIGGQTDLELAHSGYSDRKGFVEQTIYINKLTAKLIKNILKKSPTPPIIILASDHGPSASLTLSDYLNISPNHLNESGVRERMFNFEAIYFPGQNYSKLYPTITPINIFRVVLSQYYGENLELLPDKNYFSGNKARQYYFVDVTELLKN